MRKGEYGEHVEYGKPSINCSIGKAVDPKVKGKICAVINVVFNDEEWEDMRKTP